VFQKSDAADMTGSTHWVTRSRTASRNTIACCSRRSRRSRQVGGVRLARSVRVVARLEQQWLHRKGLSPSLRMSATRTLRYALVTFGTCGVVKVIPGLSSVGPPQRSGSTRSLRFSGPPDHARERRACRTMTERTPASGPGCTPREMREDEALCWRWKSSQNYARNPDGSPLACWSRCGEERQAPHTCRHHDGRPRVRDC
jgi:hypothetical protein